MQLKVELQGLVAGSTSSQTSPYSFTHTHTHRQIHNLKKQLEEDENTLVSLKEDMNSFLNKALHNYILCLKAGVRFNEFGKLRESLFNHRMSMT